MVSVLSDNVRAFWLWFQSEEDRLAERVDDPPSFFATIIEHLRKVHPGLVVEVGPEIDGRRELAISADGCLEVFPAVLATTSFAPELQRWTVVAFRQPKPDALFLSGPGFELNAEYLWFRSKPSDQLLHLDLVYSGGREVPESMLEQAGFLMVDLMVGEFAMEVYIGRCVTRRGKPQGERPLCELPGVVEAHAARVDASTVLRPWEMAM
jgi:hypothetical protein